MQQAQQQRVASSNPAGAKDASVRRQIARAIAAGTACEIEGITDAVSEIPLLIQISETTRLYHKAATDLIKAEAAWRTFSAKNSFDDPAHEEHRVKTLAARQLAEELSLQLTGAFRSLDLATGAISPVAGAEFIS